MLEADNHPRKKQSCLHIHLCCICFAAYYGFFSKTLVKYDLQTLRHFKTDYSKYPIRRDYDHGYHSEGRFVRTCRRSDADNYVSKGYHSPKSHKQVQNASPTPGSRRELKFEIISETHFDQTTSNIPNDQKQNQSPTPTPSGNIQEKPNPGLVSN